MASNNRANLNNNRRPNPNPNQNRNVGASCSRGKLTPQQAALRNRENATLRARQNRAIENYQYRVKVDAINRNGGMDNTQYALPDDIKPNRQRDYFYVMRKGICFIMFLILLITVALFAVSYLNIEQIPQKYIELGSETVTTTEGITTEGTTTEGTTTEGDAVSNADAEESSTGTGEVVTQYSLLDPVYGFIKNMSSKFMDKGIELGDSPLYDKMIAKSEIMDNTMYIILITYFPILLLLYIIIVIIMMFKAFFGMFGKRIYKSFGLGGFIMLLGGVATAFAMLVYNTEIGSKMVISNIVNIIIGCFKGGTSGLVGGYGLLALIGLPIIVLFFSMFIKKKVPYNIFDV